ncbi:phosphatase [Gaoshiqia sediminis]|uniref:Phosphatase n=1 Tax=Gaoshiqia sediminis TaxID=2986998 RepID=A0AA41Y7N1_9BACT|nr:phosphatase [Gaoshiqia sediminis]MCW0483360.1 phosphatase [Gaoshiqia sediminis]
MKLAVIDLGTNTCNLLIAEIDGKTYRLLYQGKEGVKLGKGGIGKNLLTNEAFQRATAALQKHQQTIRRYQAEKVVTIATSAVRDAANQNEFAAHLMQRTGLELTVISGEEEARLIFEGVKLAVGNLPDDTLILDIGGGSNELIQTKNNAVLWKESFPLGMARVVEQFPISDPITTAEVATIEAYFEKGLANLWTQLNGTSISGLIGCSGAFDTLADLIDQTPPGTKQRIAQHIQMSDFEAVSSQIMSSTKAQREKMTGMEPLRVEMIVPSFILIRLLRKKLKISEITQTDFALREGVLYEWINH